MDDFAAVRVAIDLLHVPSRVRAFRAMPLPVGIVPLLQIASGDAAVEAAACRATDREPVVVREAAAFFIDQILLCSEADSYRVLGSSPAASSEELRRNMSLLLKRLHPDKDAARHRSGLVTRVTTAWNNLKTDERRADYDRTLAAASSRSRSSPRQHRRRNGPRQTAGILPGWHGEPNALRRLFDRIFGRDLG